MEYKEKNELKVSLGSGWVCAFLTILFSFCKIFGVINWSWWVVLLPLWGPAALAFALVILTILAALFFGVDDAIDEE